jgi:FkbM family methyltransferase
MSTVSTVPLSDEEVIKSFPRHEGPGIPGYIVDFLGVRTRTSYISELPKEGSRVEGYPIPTNFHATAMEWAGVLRAVLEAEEQLVGIELGAGWAPWLVTLARAAAIKGIHQVHLVGVEGCKEHCDYMVSHFTDNGLDPDAHTFVHGVVGMTDGVAQFPILPDPSANYGARALFGARVHNGNGSHSLWRHLGQRTWRAIRAGIRSFRNAQNGTVRVRRFSLETLLRPFSKVDLVHVDIQGDEADVIVSAREVLKEKVKRLVIGTHGRDIEQELLDELAPQGWTLESEESCKFVRLGIKMVLTRDGCQVWRNQTWN